MSADRLPFFLALAREWRAVADGLRARGVPADDPALGVWREAAWCHLMFARGHRAAALARLPALVAAVGVSSVEVPLPADRDGAVSVAADLFARLRAAAGARHPAAFSRTAA